MDQIQPKDRQKHQQTAGLGKNEKFVGSVNPVFMSPDRNEEIHRDKHHFPEEIKQEQIY